MFKDIFKILNKAQVKYVVAGGVAVVMHGYRRFTQDLDLIVYLEKRNLEKLFDALINAGYLPKVPVTREQFSDDEIRNSWKKTKGMIVFSFVQKNPPFNLIDMFVDESIIFDEVYKQRVETKIGQIKVPILSIDHLIKLKKKAGRGKDLDDIVQLKAIKKML